MADDRFTALKTDPRYRLPNRKQSRTAVDPRFKRLFTDQDFRKNTSVDRYGRQIKPESRKKELEKLYRLDDEGIPAGKTKKVDREVVGSSEESSDEVGDEQLVGKKKDPAREGGFSDYGSEEDDSSDEDSEDEEELAEETAGQEQTEEIPMGEVSRRLAAVNLDWDNIRATDIMAVASSFVPVDGEIESVIVYPSEFGRERLQREELEGPPKEIFAKSRDDRSGTDSHSESDSGSEDDGDEDKKIEQRLQQEQVDEGEEFDTAKLRQYQLERLRYYYAVITCSNKATAKLLYDAMDGREYLSSANFFDLRFIPDDTSFEDDKPRDECTKSPDGYKPSDFKTEALTHSKVRLTWDDDDMQRKEVQKRAFSRAEMDENDLQAFIGSESSGNESVSSRKSAVEDRKLKKKEAGRAKMRAALGFPDEPTKSSSAKRDGKEEVVGDMQITFTSGLGGGGKDEKGVFENEPQDEESTRDRYIRKERDRKQKRKEKMKASHAGTKDQAVAEDASGRAEDDGEDQGFDDPFFNDPSATAEAEKKARKADKERKVAARAEKDEEAASRRAELELLTAEDQADNVRHFDMREIEKAEKDARRKIKKGNKKKRKGDQMEEADQFKLETEDPRFKALFESHEYAIDPTNPRFKGTEGMKALLEEGRRKRKVEDVDVEENVKGKRKVKQRVGDGELDGLVKRLKGKRKA